MAAILVIDDDELVRILLKETLQAEGHSVDTAENGLSGIAMIKSKHYDLLITDIVMPDKDGLETIMSVRKIEPSMKIIAMSGGGNWLAPDKCLSISKRLGASRALAKPISPERISFEVDAALKEGA